MDVSSHDLFICAASDFFNSHGLSYSQYLNVKSAESISPSFSNGYCIKRRLDCCEICRLFCSFFSSHTSIDPFSISTIVSTSGKNVFTVNCLDFMTAYSTSLLYGVIPCIRLNVEDERCSIEGHSTSCMQAFVLKYGVNFSSFFSVFELVNYFFSSLGIHASRIHYSLSDYDGGDGYSGVRISFNINNITVGSAMYYFMTPYSSSDNAMNFWFGVERICWAITGVPYFQCICTASGFLENKNKYFLEDRLRTMILFYMSELRVGNKNAAYHLKKFMKDILPCGDAINFAFFVRYYYRFWSCIFSSNVSEYDVLSRLLNDYQYLRALNYCNRYRKSNILKNLDRDEIDIFEYVIRTFAH